MPCRSEPDDYSYSADRKNNLDKLTAENCWMRELLLEIYDSNPAIVSIPARKLTQLQVAAEAHRRLDLARLEKAFVKKKDVEKLKAVWRADAKMPLKRQLGFDPNDY